MINHENICCLNTLLLLLLLARRHGDLQDVLKRVSQLADQRSPSLRPTSLSRLDSLDEEDDDEEGKVDLLGRRIVRRRGGRLLMSNFRELLWFWNEYYLRRGATV